MAAEHTLGLLMLRCETTGKPIHSGVPFTQNDLDRIRLARIHLQCPACGELHGFQLRGGLYREDRNAPWVRPVGAHPR